MTTRFRTNMRFHPTMNEFFRTLDRKLEPEVKTHLKQVYSTLSLATFAAGVGSYIHLYTDIFSGGLLAMLVGLFCAFALYVTPDTGKNYQKRLSYLMVFAGCVGLVMGPMLEVAITLNPRIIPVSFVSTCLVFGSFTLCSIFGNHSKWLYLGGGLMSMLSVMLFMSVLNLFIGSYYLYQLQLYVGLIVLCLFVIYDTAAIIEKRRHGDIDYILHAMLLFADFIDIFQRLASLLIQKERRNRDRR